jgi:uncharacterized YigZ family protein
MEDTYKTLEKPAEGLFRDKNSRFLAFGFPVDSVDQVTEILGKIKKKYHDARHHCYAYRLGTEKEIYRLNDDGEPSGTAGKPIYNQLLSREITNTLIIVVRYFGGTLLGTGGLINAYKSAAKDMLDHASIGIRYMEDLFFITFPCEKLNAVMKVLHDENLVPVQPEYAAACTMKVAVRKGLSDRLTQKICAITGLTMKML